MNYIITALKGMTIGLANLIPGVSGGTLALILGIYERMIGALHNITFETVRSAVLLLTGSRKSRENFVREMQRIDFLFLCTLFGAAAVAALLFAKVMVFLLNGYHDPTYAFFFGLVLPSLYVPYKAIKKHSPAVYCALCVAALLIAGSNNIVGDEARIEKEQTKYEMKYQALQNDTAVPAVRSFSIVDGLLLTASGVVSVSAMILPGVSGSFMLLLMGQYFKLLEAVTQYNIPYLALFMCGIVIGLLVFTRFLYFLLARFHDITMGFLTGLVAGSLWIIWPFKRSVEIGTEAVAGYPETVYLSNTVPRTLGMQEILAFAAFFLGGVIVLTMMRQEHKKKSSMRNSEIK